jgi:hypothetical protein
MRRSELSPIAGITGRGLDTRRVGIELSAMAAPPQPIPQVKIQTRTPVLVNDVVRLSIKYNRFRFCVVTGMEWSRSKQQIIYQVEWFSRGYPIRCTALVGEITFVFRPKIV